MALYIKPMSVDSTPAPRTFHIQGPEQAEFHEEAAAATRARFGRRVFVRAVVEISNYCRENCAYCGMRRSNRQLHRYRATADQLAELLIEHRPPSVTDINIQAGEDPVAVREIAIPLIRKLREQTGLGVSVCLGLHDKSVYAEMKEAGASIYILKFETANPAHYAQLEAPATFERRIADIRHLAATGWNVSSGFIAGLPGQTDAELLQNFELACELPLAGISVSPFIPGDETPLSKAPISDVDLSLNCM